MWEIWLAALCLLFAGHGRAEAGSSARFVSQSAPPLMTAGQCYSVAVTMQNTKAYDAIGNVGTSTPVTVTIANG